ncbi:MAG: hypothetical protein MI892_04745 [Desulfobacterales bacterium]|nr:hypothetical protein [Desulfobacterales bacterium]
MDMEEKGDIVRSAMPISRYLRGDDVRGVGDISVHKLFCERSKVVIDYLEGIRNIFSAVERCDSIGADMKYMDKFRDVYDFISGSREANYGNISDAIKYVDGVIEQMQEFRDNPEYMRSSVQGGLAEFLKKISDTFVEDATVYGSVADQPVSHIASKTMFPEIHWK